MGSLNAPGTKSGEMKHKRYSAQQMLSKLREAEVLLQNDQAAPQVCAVRSSQALGPFFLERVLENLA
jgi:hypothetical protein